MVNWLSGFSFRKKKPVNATTAGGTSNYQLELIIGESSGASNVDIHCNGHCQNFPNDIRFTNQNGVSKHDYWVNMSSLEGTAPNRKVSVIIEIAYIPASGSINFYMYYGKSGDSGESNGVNTFKFFDDFTAPFAKIPYGAADLSTVVYDGKIYLFGGYGTSSTDYQDEVYEYDPATDTYTAKTAMPTPRWGHIAIEHDGKVYVFGGTKDVAGSKIVIDTLEVYNIALNTWDETKLDMPYTLRGQCACFYDGLIHLFGGYNGSTYVASHFTYNPSTNTYDTTVADMGTARVWSCCGLVGTKVYIMGGSGIAGYLDVNEEYDFSGDSWVTKAVQPAAFHGAGRENPVIDGKIYVINGLDATHSFRATVYEYDPSTNTWDTKTSTNFGRDGVAVAVISDKIFVFGGRSGYIAHEVGLTIVERYDPSEDSWESAFKSKWQVPDGSPSLENNTITLEDAAGTSIFGDISWSSDIAMSFRLKKATTDTKVCLGGFMNAWDKSGHHVRWELFDNGKLYLEAERVVPDYTISEIEDYDTDYHTYTLLHLWGDKVKGYVDGVLKGTIDTDAHMPTSAVSVCFGSQDLASAEYEVDWVFVRNYMDPEPTWGTSGQEETESVEPISIGQVFTAKLGDVTLWIPPLSDQNFTITYEENNIASFSFLLQNCSVNRTAITSHLTDDFIIYRGSAPIFTGIINSDSIEYIDINRIRVSGYAKSIELAYEFYKYMLAADAEAVGGVMLLDAPSAWTNKTTEANNATINDIEIELGATDDGIYIGHNETFYTIKIQYSTKGVQSGTPVLKIEYSQGSSAWATLDCIDTSQFFTDDVGEHYIIIPNKPSDWAKDTVNGVNRFWIRIVIVSGAYSINPKLDQIWISQTDVCRVQFDNLYLDDMLDDVLEGTGYTSDAGVPHIIIPGIRGEYYSKLQWVAGLASAATWEDGNGYKQNYLWWIDSSKVVHIAESTGVSFGDITSDLNVLTNKRNYFDLSNRLFSLGSGDGINQTRAAIEDITSQTANGLREALVTDARILEYGALKEFTQKALTASKDEQEVISLSMSTYDWFEGGYAISDVIKLHQPIWGIPDETEYRIIRCDIGKDIVKIDVGDPRQHLDTIQADLKAQIDVNDVYMAGATNIYAQSVQGNMERTAGNVYPLILKIRIPDDAVKINKVLLDWTLSGFRTYTSVAGDGGSCSPTSDEGGADVVTSGGHYLGSQGMSFEYVGDIQTFSDDMESDAPSQSGTYVYLPTSLVIRYQEMSEYSNCSNLSCEHVYPIPYPYITAQKVNNDNHTANTTIESLSGYGIDEHDHMVDAYGSHTHSVSIPDHTHTVTIEDHTHPLTSGIIEESLGSPTLELYVNDVLVGNAYTGDNSDINIAGYMAVGTWNEIKLQPKASTVALLRAELNAFIKVFIRSR